MIGTHPNVGFKFGRWLDTVMMQRALGDGARRCRPVTFHVIPGRPTGPRKRGPMTGSAERGIRATIGYIRFRSSAPRPE